MTSTSIVLLLIGILFLCYSLKPTTAICNNVESQRTKWQGLYALILFFISGYLLFIGYVLNTKNSGVIELVVAIIFFSGAIFVALVTHLSLATILSGNQATQKMQQLADIDQLTQLPNRHFFNQLMAQQAAQINPEPYCLILIDLNKFKLINDVMGHETADLLLVEVAQRLNSFSNHYINVCRLGGDEFALFARRHTHEQLIRLVRKIKELMQLDCVVNDQQININLSIGVASYPFDHKIKLTVLKQAGLAIDHAKNTSVPVVFYSDKLAQQLNEINNKLHQLERAILSSELFLHYQPIVDSKSGRVVSVEALARWVMHDGTEVSPTEFIPLAQSNNLIHSITTFVLDEALEQLAKWHQQHLMVKMNINLSASDFQDVFLAQRFIHLLAHYNIPAEYLILEITEGVLIDNIERAKANIEKLRQAGVSIALDDFGIGFSSLNYLRVLNINQLKLDCSFTKSILDYKKDLEIIKSTIALAHQVGCTVTAEGVESEMLNDKLTELDCDFLQGYWLSIPLSAPQATQYIIAMREQNTPTSQPI